jgi:hypothetical protein
MIGVSCSSTISSPSSSDSSTSTSVGLLIIDINYSEFSNILFDFLQVKPSG